MKNLFKLYLVLAFFLFACDARPMTVGESAEFAESQNNLWSFYAQNNVVCSMQTGTFFIEGSTLYFLDAASQKSFQIYDMNLSNELEKMTYYDNGIAMDQVSFYYFTNNQKANGEEGVFLNRIDQRGDNFQVVMRLPNDMNPGVFRVAGNKLYMHYTEGLEGIDHLAEIDLTSKKIRELAQGYKVQFFHFYKDALYFSNTDDMDQEVFPLYRLDLRDYRLSKYMDVSSNALSIDQDHIAYSLLIDGRHEIRLRNMTTNEDIKIYDGITVPVLNNSVLLLDDVYNEMDGEKAQPLHVMKISGKEEIVIHMPEKRKVPVIGITRDMIFLRTMNGKIQVIHLSDKKPHPEDILP